MKSWGNLEKEGFQLDKQVSEHIMQKFRILHEKISKCLCSSISQSLFYLGLEADFCACGTLVKKKGSAVQLVSSDPKSPTYDQVFQNEGQQEILTLLIVHFYFTRVSGFVSVFLYFTFIFL